MAWTNDMVDMFGNHSMSTAGLKLATMTGANSCMIGNLQLTSADLLFADHLLQTKCVKVSEVAPKDGGTCTDKSSYMTALKAGDTVLVYQLSDSKFLVIERMVSG